MELSQEHFDKSMKSLFDYVASKESLGELSKRVDKIEETLDIHTRALDKLLKDMENRENDKLITIQRFDRLESWAKQVAEKVGVKIDF